MFGCEVMGHLWLIGGVSWLVGRASLVDRKGIMGEQAVKGIPHAVLRTLDSLARSMMWSNQPRNGRLCFRRGGFWEVAW